LGLVNADKKKLILIISSYFFYGYWDWRFLGLIWLSTLIDFSIGNLIHKTLRKNIKLNLLIISIFSNLIILGIFKYFNFFVHSLNHFMNEENYFNTMEIILPVGISFYTFQSMAYTIDIYKARIKPAKTFIDFANFIAFFPQLVAGPIERAKNLLPQLQNFKGSYRNQLSRIIILLFLGYIKKVIFADNIGTIVDKNFIEYDIMNSFDVIFTLYLFSLQIYFDFSGYSDFARGIALIFGVDLMRNFNQPYFSKSPKEFWSRWHISLSNWLRDYVYIPLGGNKGSFIRTNINVLLTMLLGGLWHGASWNFVLWGFLHAIYILTNNLFIKLFKLKSKKNIGLYFKNTLQIFFTYILILITWLPFRSNDIDITTKILDSLLQLNFVVNYKSLKIAVFLLFVLIIIDLPAYLLKNYYYLEKLPKQLLYSLIFFLITFGVVINSFINSSPNKPFIYFQF
jgi:D-alanyl-lipoteichoic acid acyltransferase DltB (MBOAT superfamily)